MSTVVVPKVCYVRTYSEVFVPNRPPCRLDVLHRWEGGACVPFVPLIRFFLEVGMALKLRTQRQLTVSVQRFLDHLAAHGKVIAAAEPADLKRFTDDLVCGTTDEDGYDSCGLYWRPATVEVARGHLQHVSQFCDWLATRLGYRSLNPWRSATPGEKRRTLNRFEQRSHRSLLSHAAMRRTELQKADRARSIQVKNVTPSGFDDIRVFAEEDFQRLMEIGWGWRPAQREKRHHRLRNTLISILLHCGGLRLSEVFHLYVGDVQPHPNKPGHAMVWLFHPEVGEAPSEPGGPWRDRAHYLKDRWSRRPRNLERGRFHAGWKNLALTNSQRKATQVWFFPIQWGREFWRLYGEYVALRPNGRHPFLFVSETPAQRGQPYTMDAFKEAHARAVRRAGLVVGKHLGTSPHGHRHAFGTALCEAGLDPIVIQRALHHRNLLSQDVYKSVNAARVAEALERASETAVESLLPANLRNPL